MSFATYRAYKDSGAEWVEQVPEHWHVSRLGFECWIRARLGWRGLKAEEYVDDGFVFLSTPNIKPRNIDFENVNFITAERFDESPEIKLREGDVLLAKDGSTLGTVNVIRILPRPATVNSSIAVVSPGTAIDSIYLYYFLASSYVQQTIQRIKGGMGVPHLFQDDLIKFHCFFPGLAEQRDIATVLDHETARIDALVAEQRHLIGLLQEKRQAVITLAVTKGLNPDSPMKSSRNEWLGAVPAHWTVTSVRHAVARIEQGWSPECDSRPAEIDEWGIVKSGCVNRGHFSETENKALPAAFAPIPELEIRCGDVLMSRASGSPALVGSTAYISKVRPRLMLSDKIFRIHPAENVDSEFFVELFNSRVMRAEIERAISGAEGLANNLPQSALRQFGCAFPAIHEQRAIVVFLKREKAKLDGLILENLRAIDLLEERKSALIVAAVTGKIDVRGLASRDAI